MSRCSFSPTATFHTTAHTKMTSANHPRFRLLIGWCCLMSSALLIIIICLSINSQDKPKTEANSGNQEQNSTVTDGKTDQRIGLHPVHSSNDYIHLIRDPKEIWICYPCKNSSLFQKNSTVNITVSGLYFIHAQVTFQISNNPSSTGSVVLRKNKVPGMQERILSKVKHSGSGTATMIHLVELTKGDSITLEIHPISSTSYQDYDTYWEIMLLNNK